MAYVASHRPSRVSFFEFAANIVASWKAERARRVIFNQTLGELRGMSDRDLADIGIARIQIEDIAFEAAYGQ